jgi:cytochrome c-type biogenesis protein CcsB
MKNSNRLIPGLALLVTFLWLAAGWRSQAPDTETSFDSESFGKLPVLSGGRFKPLDTVARNSLLIMSGRQTLHTEDGERLSSARWLVDVLFDPTTADGHPSFLIQNPEVLGMMGITAGEKKRFSFDDIRSHVRKIDEEGRRASEVEAALRTPFQTAVLNLRNTLLLYQQLQDSITPPGVESAVTDYLRPVPPAARGGTWQPLATSLAPMNRDKGSAAVAEAYLRLREAAQSSKTQAFNREVEALTNRLAEDAPAAVKRVRFEHLFNHLEPFYRSMGLYVLAALLGLFSWLAASSAPGLRRAGVLVLLVALAIHTFGLVARMYLQGRPPVTNLYSSAVFIGWGTVIAGLILERIYRDGIGIVSAGAIGFTTLIIAHHLAGSGDTLEMLQAVLDTNIWLATHVVVITLGYSAMFLAGALAIIYILRGVLTRSLDKSAARSLERMTYGVICFATLFSFVGTVLGGIWADQSWGRFWGWDPKENGALLIVLICAIILHARWGGFIRGRGMMILALLGNIITSFSWFGVNMLGVGLHSYGFMNKAFPWLIAFVVSQALLMALAAVPSEKWRSFRPAH